MSQHVAGLNLRYFSICLRSPDFGNGGNGFGTLWVVRASVPIHFCSRRRARRVKDRRVADPEHDVGVLRVQVHCRNACGVVADPDVRKGQAMRVPCARHWLWVHKLLVDFNLDVARAVPGAPRRDGDAVALLRQRANDDVSLMLCIRVGVWQISKPLTFREACWGGGKLV